MTKKRHSVATDRKETGETQYLLASKKNRKHLKKSLKEVAAGKIVAVDLL